MSEYYLQGAQDALDLAIDWAHSAAQTLQRRGMSDAAEVMEEFAAGPGHSLLVLKKGLTSGNPNLPQLPGLDIEVTPEELDQAMAEISHISNPDKKVSK